MKAKNISSGYVVAICACISLFSVSISGFLTLSLSDLIIGLLLVYALTINKLTFKGPELYAIVFFALAALFSGLMNSIFEYDFAAANFLVNYVRIIGLVGMILLIPPIQTHIGHDKLARATLWVLRVHAILLIADAFFENPLNWTDSGITLSQNNEFVPRGLFGRPRGLFIEPSWYGIYTGISILYICQIEKNYKIKYLNTYDIILICLSLIASTSLSAIGLLILFIYELIRKSGKFNSLKIIGSLGALILLLVFFANRFERETRTGINLIYVVSKVGNLRHGFNNENISTRLGGSFLTSLKVIDDSPYYGIGLGAKNQNRLLKKLGEKVEGFKTSEETTYSMTVMPASALTATGLIGFIPYTLIFLLMFISKKTLILGRGLVAIWFMWGNAFSPMIWWYICLGLSLKYSKSNI